MTPYYHPILMSAMGLILAIWASEARDCIGPGSGPGQRNAKRLCRKAFALVAGVGFHGFAVVSAMALPLLRLNKLPIQPSPKPTKKAPRRGLFCWLRE